MKFQGRTWVKSIVRDQTWVRAFRADAATQQRGLCFYCREPLTSDTISGDHIIPRSRGGSTQRKNIKAACRDCNIAKKSMSEKEFLVAIKHLSPDSSLRIMLTYMRRKVWVRTHRACDLIERYAR